MLFAYFFFVVKSFIELVEYIFSIPGVEKFLSGKLSQDPLEKFFGCVRQSRGINENIMPLSLSTLLKLYERPILFVQMYIFKAEIAADKNAREFLWRKKSK